MSNTIAVTIDDLFQLYAETLLSGYSPDTIVFMDEREYERVKQMLETAKEVNANGNQQ